MLCSYAEDEDKDTFGAFYVIMDYDGVTLRNVLDGGEHFSIRSTLELATQMIVGLAYDALEITVTYLVHRKNRIDSESFRNNYTANDSQRFSIFTLTQSHTAN